MLVSSSQGYSDQSQYSLRADAAISIETLTANLDPSTGIVTINGWVISGAGKQLAISVFNPEQNIENIGQVGCDENGDFIFSFKLKSLVEGTYQVLVNGENIAIPAATTFDYVFSSQINPITTTTPSSTQTVTKTVNFVIDNVADATALAPDAQLDAVVNVTNNATVAQNILVAVALFSPDGSLEDCVTAGTQLAAGETGEAHGGFLLPHDVAGYQVKVFVWEGMDLKETSLVPISQVVNIPENNLNSVEGNVAETGSAALLRNTIWDKLEILESEENNMELMSSVNVSFSPEFSDSVLRPGAIFTAKVTIKNNGSSSQNVAPVLVQYDNSGMQTNITAYNRTLAPGKSTTVNYSIPVKYTTGKIVLYFVDRLDNDLNHNPVILKWPPVEIKS